MKHYNNHSQQETQQKKANKLAEPFRNCLLWRSKRWKRVRFLPEIFKEIRVRMEPKVDHGFSFEVKGKRFHFCTIEWRKHFRLKVRHSQCEWWQKSRYSFRPSFLAFLCVSICLLFLSSFYLFIYVEWVRYLTLPWLHNNAKFFSVQLRLQDNIFYDLLHHSLVVIK